jgi:hypothetical protein
MEMSYNLNDIDINLDEIEKALMDLKKKCEDAIIKMNDELNNPSNWPFLDRLFKIKKRCPSYINTKKIDIILKDIKKFKEANKTPREISLRAGTLCLHYYDTETGNEVTTKWSSLVSCAVVHNIKVNKPTITFKLEEKSYGIEDLWICYNRGYSMFGSFLSMNSLLYLKKKITVEIPVFEQMFVEIKNPVLENIPFEKE